MYVELPEDPIVRKEAAPVSKKNDNYEILVLVILFIFCMILLQFTLNPLVNELRIQNLLLNASLYQTAELVQAIEQLLHSEVLFERLGTQ